MNIETAHRIARYHGYRVEERGIDQVVDDNGGICDAYVCHETKEIVIEQDRDAALWHEIAHVYLYATNKEIVTSSAYDDELFAFAIEASWNNNIGLSDLVEYSDKGFISTENVVYYGQRLLEVDSGLSYYSKYYGKSWSRRVTDSQLAELVGKFLEYAYMTEGDDC